MSFWVAILSQRTTMSVDRKKENLPLGWADTEGLLVQPYRYPFCRAPVISPPPLPLLLFPSSISPPPCSLTYILQSLAGLPNALLATKALNLSVQLSARIYPPKTCPSALRSPSTTRDSKLPCPSTTRLSLRTRPRKCTPNRRLAKYRPSSLDYKNGGGRRMWSR